MLIPRVGLAPQQDRRPNRRQHRRRSVERFEPGRL